MFGIGGWTKIVGGMPITYIYFPFPAGILTQEGSRNLTKYKCIGEQVIHLRWIMTSMFWGIYVQILHYSFRIGNVPERDSERSEESIFLFFLGSLSSNRKMREPFQMKGV